MLEANYKDTRMTLTEPFLVPFFSWFWKSFCFLGYSQKILLYYFKQFFKLFYCSEIFEYIWRGSFMLK